MFERRLRWRDNYLTCDSSIPRQEVSEVLPFAQTVSLLSEGVIMGAWNPWENSAYCWVVICKNAKVHSSANVNAGHKIPLAETDAFEVLPVSAPIEVQCDACGEERTYEPSDIVRLEFNVPEGFATHPRFK